MSASASKTETRAAAGGVQALETGLSVLEAFVSSVRPMMLKDIAQAAGMHPAKAHRYLASFIKRGYVEQDAHGRYSLGRGAVRIGLAGLAQIDAVRLATPLLDDLGASLRETVFAAVWGNRGPTVVQWRDAPHDVTVNVRPGSVLPMLSSATGRVFAAWMDAAAAGPLVQAELAQGSGAHPADLPKNGGQLARLLQRVREAGLGTVEGDLVAGVKAVSAPVFDHEGKLVLAITALGGHAAFDATPEGRPAAEVRAAARALSERLGHGVLAA